MKILGTAFLFALSFCVESAHAGGLSAGTLEARIRNTLIQGVKSGRIPDADQLVKIKLFSESGCSIRIQAHPRSFSDGSGSLVLLDLDRDARVRIDLRFGGKHAYSGIETAIPDFSREAALYVAGLPAVGRCVSAFRELPIGTKVGNPSLWQKSLHLGGKKEIFRGKGCRLVLSSHEGFFSDGSGLIAVYDYSRLSQSSDVTVVDVRYLGGHPIQSKAQAEETAQGLLRAYLASEQASGRCMGAERSIF